MEAVVLLLVLVVNPLVGYAIGNPKGKGGLGVLLGLLLGFIGWIIIACIPADPKTDLAVRRCPQCGVTLAVGARFCSNCGKDTFLTLPPQGG